MEAGMSRRNDNRGNPQRGQFMLRKARVQGARFAPCLIADLHI
jgi:hypothetical protein